MSFEPDKYLTLKATLFVSITRYVSVSNTNWTDSTSHLTEFILFSGQIVKTCEFWILWSTFFLNTQAIGYINSMYKAYGQVFINDDHFLAVVGAFAAIFNASGRVFWGHLCDKFGYRSCMLVVTASMVGYAASNLKGTQKSKF